MRPLVIIGLLAGAVGFAIYKGANRFVDRLKLEFSKVTIDLPQTKQSLFTQLYYTLTLKFINNETFKADIKSMSLDVFLGDKQIGRISRDTTFSIPARDRIETQFDLRISTLSVLTSIPALINALTNKTGLPPVTVNGFLMTAFGRIEVNQTMPISI